MQKSSNILILGYESCIGKTLKNNLLKQNYKNIISDEEIDPHNFHKLQKFIKLISPDYVFNFYSDSGSLRYNIKNSNSLFYNNFNVSLNIVKSLENIKFKKLIYLSSSCIYPKNLIYPHKVNDLLQGMPIESSLNYALAKLSSMSYYNRLYKKRSLIIIPSTIYGPNDNFDLTKSHVLSAIMLKIHLAKLKNKKKLVLYGSGKPVRDFIYSEELSNLIIHLIKNKKYGIFNLTDKNKKISIKDLSIKLKKIIGYRGDLIFDNSEDGSNYKTLDSSIKNKKYFFDFDLSLYKSYQWYLKNINTR